MKFLGRFYKGTAKDRVLGFGLGMRGPSVDSRGLV